MRFISMHKTDKATEAGAPPSPEVLAGMGPLMEEITKAGVFRAGEGLRPSSLGVRLNFSGGKRTITPGPFEGNNELIAGFCIVKVPSIDDAVSWATRFADIVGDVEIDVRPVTEAWDLGFMPKPESETSTRYMLAHKADRDSESGRPPSPEVMARMGTLMEDIAKAGVFVTAEGLQPSANGVRLRYAGGKRTAVIDGPFAESKELIGGYSILDVPSIDDAVVWADRFAALFPQLEIDIRPLYGQETCA